MLAVAIAYHTHLWSDREGLSSQWTEIHRKYPHKFEFVSDKTGISWISMLLIKYSILDFKLVNICVEPGSRAVTFQAPNKWNADEFAPS